MDIMPRVPSASDTPMLCPDCARSGLSQVVMRFIIFDWQWRTVLVPDTSVRYADLQTLYPQRQKVRCGVWRCPNGHRHEEVYP